MCLQWSSGERWSTEWNEKTGTVPKQFNFVSVKKPVWKHTICALYSCTFCPEKDDLWASRLISACALCSQWGMNRGLLLRFENLVQLHGACRQLQALSSRKVCGAQWKPMELSAHPMGSLLLHPQPWPKHRLISAALSQCRHLATKEVIKDIQ